ncbi:DNA primase [Streptomyces sp. NPDC002790]|uniref:DNA primase n=1 Tax=Streptomyces sp. NPDC002790 TaxID=3154431 RepID=UPI00332FFC22
MNRAALGLAVGAGYFLGRTKKMKLAFAVGTMVAGKRLKLSPRALLDLANQQLANNPQFKEIGDQLREDLRGVGKAASGALVERQVEGIAGRLHDRTQGVRDQIAGVAPDVDDVRDAGERVTGNIPGRRRSGEDEHDGEAAYDDESYEDAAYEDEQDEASDSSTDDTQTRTARKPAPAKRAPAKKTAAKRAPAKKSAAQKPPAKKTAAKRTVSAGSRGEKGGRDRG